MVSPYSVFDTDSTIGGWMEDPTTAPTYFQQMMDENQYRTPEEEWGMLTAGQPAFWERRAPIQDMGKNLRASYLLAAPHMLAQDVYPTFRDYATQMMPTYGSPSAWLQGGLPSWSAAGADPGMGWEQGQRVLRARAQEAARAAELDAVQYLGKVEDEYGFNSPEFKRAFMYQQQFSGQVNDPTQALKNQLAVAQMLATQRKGGGVWGGNVGRAMRGALERVMRHRQNVGDEKASFLSYYLGSQPREASGIHATGIPTGPSQLASGTQTGGLSPEEIRRLQAQRNFQARLSQNVPQRRVDYGTAGSASPYIQPIEDIIPVGQANLPAAQIETALASAIQPGTSVPAANVWDAYTQGQGLLGLKEDFINTMMTNNNMTRQQAEAFWEQQRITNPTLA